MAASDRAAQRATPGASCAMRLPSMERELPLRLVDADGYAQGIGDASPKRGFGRLGKGRLLDHAPVLAQGQGLAVNNDEAAAARMGGAAFPADGHVLQVSGEQAAHAPMGHDDDVA